MPEPAASSWADEIEEGDSSSLPAPTEKVKGDTKVVTEYIFNEDGKKMRVVRTYKIEKKMVPKSVAQRRAWAKFGMSKSDKAGPNPQTTVVAEEIWEYIVANKDESEKEQEQSALDKLKGVKGVVKCRSVSRTLNMLDLIIIPLSGSVRRTTGPLSVRTRTRWGRCVTLS